MFVDSAACLRWPSSEDFVKRARQIKEAVRLYTQAIDVGCTDPPVAAANFNNRAAAHLVRR